MPAIVNLPKSISIALLLLGFTSFFAKGETVEADNGATFRILSTQVIDNHWRGGDKPYAMATVVDDDGAVRILVFDCEGSYAPGDVAHAPWQHVPPRSVAAGISQIACKLLRTTQQPSPAPPSYPGLPAPQWIANCIQTFESPKGRLPYEILSKAPPTHSENLTYCKEQWNTVHPNERLPVP